MQISQRIELFLLLFLITSCGAKTGLGSLEEGDSGPGHDAQADIGLPDTGLPDAPETSADALPDGDEEDAAADADLIDGCNPAGAECGVCGLGCPPSLVCEEGQCSEPDPIEQLVAGGSHSCARRASGQWGCWGSNDTDQLTQDPRLATSEHLSLGGPRPSGHGHTCTVTPSGEAWCWGINGSGMLGRGEPGEIVEPPAPVVNVEGIFRTEGGPFNVCAIVGGAVRCAGLNNSGQLGLEMDGDPHPTPVPIEGLAQIEQVAIAGWHMCARRSDGAVFCWGDNLYGGLGAGPGPRHSFDPQRVVGVDDAIDVDTQQYHSCLVRRTGQVRCWGNNFGGQLGIGVDRDESFGHHTPEPVVVIDSAIDVEVGSRASYALLENGEVWSWGVNLYGQLGTGSDEIEHTGTPQQTMLPGRAVGLAAGMEHACALVDVPEVHCWEPEGGSRCVSVEHRRVFCWGRNGWGEVSEGEGDSVFLPVEPAYFAQPIQPEP